MITTTTVILAVVYILIGLVIGRLMTEGESGVTKTCVSILAAIVWLPAGIILLGLGALRLYFEIQEERQEHKENLRKSAKRCAEKQRLSKLSYAQLELEERKAYQIGNVLRERAFIRC